jgi:hypothetical protein
MGALDQIRDEKGLRRRRAAGLNSDKLLRRFFQKAAAFFTSKNGPVEPAR